MAIYRGVNAVITKEATTMDDIFVHGWTLSIREQRFDITGETDVNVTFATGDRVISLRLDCSSQSGGTLIMPKEVLTITLATGGGGSYQEDYTVENVDWQVEKRGGGPPQRMILTMTPNHVLSANTAATVLFAATG